MVVIASMTVSATLTLASDVMGTDDKATFEQKIKPTIAKAADVDASAVSVRVSTTSRRRSRGLLAAAVTVFVDVTYGVDGTPAVREMQIDKSVAFMSKARYMTSSLLPTAMAGTPPFTFSCIFTYFVRISFFNTPPPP